MLKSIEEEWKGFSSMIFKKLDPSQVQIDETKQAFFAGAWAILCALNEVGEPHISEDQGVAYFEERQAEGKAFYQDLIKRYAERN